MTEFARHTPETAPAAAQPILAATAKSWGFVPNLHAVLAESPVTLEGHNSIFAQFDRSSFSPVERQVVLLTASYENECHYCMAGHSALARMAGMAPAVLDALRDGAPLPDARLQALRRFTGAMVRNRGAVAPGEVDAFIAAGFTRAQVLEVILGIAVKTIANYTNHIADTPLDAFMADTVWTGPAARAAA